MNGKLTSLMSARMKVLLVGPPGIAKTGRIASAARDTGRRLIVMRASLSERVDFGGCLVPDAGAGITRALPLELLADLQVTTEPTLLFLDDLGQAPMDVQAACMRLFDAGFLSDSVLIAGATNRPSDRAGVSALCEPLRSRFDVSYRIATPNDTTSDSVEGGQLLSPWSEELDHWLDWMTENNAPPEIIAWHASTRGRTAYAWKPHADPSVRMPDYRTWHTVARLWNAGIRDAHSISATIGKPAAMEFLAFAQLAAELPTMDEIRSDPSNAKVPSQPASLFFVATLVSQQCTRRDARAVVTYFSRLPRVFGALIGRSLYKRMADKLSSSPEWASWISQNQDLFTL